MKLNEKKISAQGSRICQQKLHSLSIFSCPA